MLEKARVKSCLEGWREPVLHVASLLFWEKEWYPGVIAGLLTAKFLFVWYWDPTLLSLFAMTGLFITLADFIGPKIIAQVGQALRLAFSTVPFSTDCCLLFLSRYQIFKPESWTGDKEKRFEQVCSDLVSATDGVRGAWNFCREAKEKKPVVHFVGTLMALLLVSYVGSRINNFFLLYLLTLTLVLLPGAHKKGLLKKYFGQAMQKVGEAIKGKDGLKKVE